MSYYFIFPTFVRLWYREDFGRNFLRCHYRGLRHMDDHVSAVFAVQASVTALMLSFCMAMLIRGGEPGVFLPVMTGITGFWFPSPLQHTDRQTSAPPPSTTVDSPV